uniref:Mitochondrial ribosomal protein L15 n=1 Tax=Parascaris equorum TaxID=6256 RepID=A0A914RQ44_PAREQ
MLSRVLVETVSRLSLYLKPPSSLRTPSSVGRIFQRLCVTSTPPEASSVLKEKNRQPLGDQKTVYHQVALQKMRSGRDSRYGGRGGGGFGGYGGRAGGGFGSRSGPAGGDIIHYFFRTLLVQKCLRKRHVAPIMLGKCLFLKTVEKGGRDQMAGRGLREIDWRSQDLKQIEKNFYHELPVVAQRSQVWI